MPRPGALGRNVLTLLAALTTAGALTWIEGRLLWGYWFYPPTSVLGELRASRVQGISRLTVSRDDPFESLLVEPGGLRDPTSLCGDDAPSACEEGEAVREALSLNGGTIRPVAGIDETMWPAIRRSILDDARSSVAPRGEPTSGLAIQLGGDKQYFWISYYTREIENDWHNKVQVLYAIEPDGPRLVDRQHYRYEVAGLESLPLWVLWAVNSVILACGVLVFRSSGASQRTVRRVGKAIGLVASLLGVGLFAVVCAGVHRHDPWLVVLAMLAVLLVTCGLGSILLGARRRGVSVG